MRLGDWSLITRERLQFAGHSARRRVFARLVLILAIALSVVIVTPNAASARTVPASIDDVIDLGPQMVKPWGQPPANSTFSAGLWTSNRDCGVSTPLSNGRRLWVYCDSSMFDQNLVHKSNSASNTAALEHPYDKKIVQDYFAWGALKQFIPTQTFYPCSGYRATWPSSIATLPDVDGNVKTDRVVIFFQNNCIDLATGALAYFEIGVALFDYDATRLGPFKATVINPSLFPRFDGQDMQFGATVAPDGFGSTHLYLYSCQPGGACFTKRVWVTNDAAGDYLRLQDSAQYASWTGSGWATGAAPAELFSGGGEATATGDGIHMAYVPAIGRYVMSYTPFPVLHHLVAIRTAPRPEGPWSNPTTAELPGCLTTESCYAANVQPQLSDATHIGLSYLKYNDFVGWSPAPRNYGRIHLIKVPWLPARSAAVVQNNVEFVFEIHNGDLAFEYFWEGAWVKWFPIGTARKWKGQPAVTRNAEGFMVVFATSTDGIVFVIKQRPDGQFDDPIMLTNNVLGSGELAAATLANGCLEVFITDPNGRVFHDWQIPINGVCTWSTFGFWPLSLNSTFRASKGIAVAPSQDGRLHLFGADSTGRVHHTWQQTPNGSENWTADFVPISNSTFRATKGLAATNEFDGRVHLFGIDPYGQVLHIWQNTPNGFTDWSSLGFWLVAGSSTSGGISASRGSNGLVTAYTTSKDMMNQQRAVETTVNTPGSLTSFSQF